MDRALEGQYADQAHGLLQLPEVLESHYRARSTGDSNMKWSYTPKGFSSHLQIDTFGLGRIVVEIGGQTRCWFFWPPSRQNLSRISKMKDRQAPDVAQLAKLTGGYMSYVARDRDELFTFYIPPYYAFFSMAVEDCVYISLSTFDFDSFYHRTILWMREELELLRDGWTITDNSVDQANHTFKKITQELLDCPDIPHGVKSVCRDVMVSLSDIEDEELDPIVQEYLNAESG